MIGLYNADIAGLFGGTGGGNPLFPIAVEDDGDTLACQNEKILSIDILLNVINNCAGTLISNENNIPLLMTMMVLTAFPNLPHHH